MYILILDNQIAGTVQNSEEAPDMFEVVQTEYTGDLDNLYYDGTNVLVKPPKHDPDSYWDTVKNTWVSPKYPDSVKVDAPLTKHELAPVLYQILSEVHPAVAECLTYLLAQSQGDMVTARGMLENLITRCNTHATQ